MNQTPSYEPITLPGVGKPELKARYWRSESATAPRLLLVHGACEHGGRYETLGNLAAEAGFEVLIPDLRGHGLSSGAVVHVDRFEEYLEHLQSWMELVDFQHEKLLLVGCSMGGLISIRFCQWIQQQTGAPACNHLFLISPLLGIKHPIEKWKKFVARQLSRVYPQLRFRSTINPRLLTHDENILQQRAKDTLLRKQVTARWFLECDQHRQMAFAAAEIPFPPTTIWQAGADAVVDPLAVKAWAAQVRRNSVNQVDFRDFPGWYHEIFKENEGPELQRQFVQLLQEKAVIAKGRENVLQPVAPPVVLEKD